MSTQVNPLVAEAAKGLLASVDTKLASLDTKYASKSEFKEDIEALKGLFSKEVAEANKKYADLLKEITDLKQSPAIVRSKNAWKVRSRLTGNVMHPEFSLGKIFWALKMQKENGSYPTEKIYEREVDYCKRAVSEASGSAGGTLIPQEWSDFVIPELGAQTVVLKANPVVLPMQHQIMNVPGLTNNQTCAWLGEAAAITESSPTTNNTALTLHTAKSLTALSIEWTRDASPETDAALQANLVRGMARFLDLGYLSGAGGSNTPTGFLNVGSIGQIYAGGGATNGSTPTYDDFNLAVDQLEGANAPREGRCWFMSTRSMTRVRGIKDSLGHPLFVKDLNRTVVLGPDGSIVDLTSRNPDGYILGYPVYTTTQISNTQTRGSASTCSSILLVAMSDIYIGQGIKSQGLEVAISDQALFANAQIAVRILARTDMQPGHAASIAALSGVL